MEQQNEQAKPQPKARGGFMKGAAFVALVWAAYAIGTAQSAPPAPVEPPAASSPAPKAKARHARPMAAREAAPIRVACGAYAVTFKPHDFSSRSDAIEAATAYAFDHEGCEFK